MRFRYRVTWKELVLTNHPIFSHQKEVREFSEMFITRKEAEDFARLADEMSTIRDVRIIDTVNGREV